VAAHQLHDPDIPAVGQQSTRAFVPEVVPQQIDLLKLLPVPGRTRPRPFLLEAVRREP
jgi:hypothetical protein